MATMIKMWTTEEDFGEPTFYSKVKVSQDKTYASLRLRLEEKSALDWPFDFWDKKKAAEFSSRKKSLKDAVTDNEFEKMLLPEVIPPDELRVTFDHISALHNVEETLRELVMLPLQRVELFVKGQLTKPCKDMLLFGPPGIGKTTLAKAVTTDVGANFINISMSMIASKEFVL